MKEKTMRTNSGNVQDLRAKTEGKKSWEGNDKKENRKIKQNITMW